MFKVICVENTYSYSVFEIGQLYDCEQVDNAIFRVSSTYHSSLLLNKHFVFTTQNLVGQGLIKFEKYNYRKEKLERILSNV